HSQTRLSPEFPTDNRRKRSPFYCFIFLTFKSFFSSAIISVFGLSDPTMLKRAIHKWERKLSTRDTNRVIRPFEWGVEFLDGFLAQGTEANSAGLDAAEPREVIFDFNARAICESERFFEAGPVSHFDFDGHWLAFRSPVSTPYAKNNTAY